MNAPEKQRTVDESADKNLDLLATVHPLASYDPDKTDLLKTVVPEESAEPEPYPTIIHASDGEESASFDVTIAQDDASRISELCAQFESAWESGEHVPRLDHFVPDDLGSNVRLSLVRQLVLLDIEHRRRTNRSIDQSDYLSQMPAFRAAVESAFSQLSSMSSESSSSQQSSSQHSAGRTPRGYGSVSVPEESVRTVGQMLQHAGEDTSRYRPTKFHAKGGLGAVYQARDKELNRLVALKRILKEFADNPWVRDKFVFEAEVTGSLEHPGIVPVYGLGHYQDNQPYYAMRFIRGESFRETIHEFHTADRHPTAGMYDTREFRSLLRRFIDACNAIHYAHEHGVLHRDIKPENIMLGRYGETLVVDWGLAKLYKVEDDEGPDLESTQIRITTTSSSSQTSHGSTVGTPMYMSPEQARGQHTQLDPRTDVYSLGAMLFNLASNEYPIEGKTARDVVLNVRSGVRRSLNSIVPSAPKAISSICEKAMALRPEDRYASAAELADDVDRWLNDEVVKAHVGHETIPEKAGRLIRRYRSWTISAGAALLVVTAVAIVSALAINSAKRKEEIAKQQATEFKLDAVARYRDSRDAIDTWFVQSSDALEFFPGTQSVRQRLLELATEDYAKLSARKSLDPELELERARALVKLGDLKQIQADFDGARNDYNTALRLLETTAANEDMIGLFRAEHGNVHTRLGLAYSSDGNSDRAELEFRSAIRELTQQTSTESDPLSTRLLAVARVNLGELHFGLDQWDEAIEQLGESLLLYASLNAGEDLQAQPRVASEQPRVASELGAARARELLGRIYIRQNQHEQAIVILNESIARLEQLVRQQPDHPEFLDALASAYVSAATSYRERGLQEPLFSVLRLAATHYRALVTALPDLPKYEENLALTLIDLGLALHETGANADALTVVSEADERLQAMMNAYPYVPRLRQRYGACLDALGQVFLDTKEDASEATATLARAVTTYQQLVVSEPVPDYFRRQAIAQSHYAQSLQRQNDFDAASQYFGGAISTLSQLIQIEGRLPNYLHALAHMQMRLGYLQHQQGSDQAATSFQAAVALWTEMDPPTASALNECAWLLSMCPDDSIRDPETAVKMANDAVQLAPDNPRYAVTQAMAALMSGDAARSLSILDDASPDTARRTDRDWFVRSMAQQSLGNSDQARQSLDAGIQWMSQRRPHNADLRRLRTMCEKQLESEES